MKYTTNRYVGSSVSFAGHAIGCSGTNENPTWSRVPSYAGKNSPRPRTDVVLFPRVKRSWLLADLGFSSSPLASLFIQEKRKSNHVSPRIYGTGAEISARTQNLLLVRDSLY
ncbi:hypothetical protein I7I53_03478 [Histoplasma capsulatum var. duboisii H88]|uniref:Uncharacterized protein n=1 Tax=Ajellomyces capsulatus (strain H88) TaxID=544711 RepID=A0A8A1LR09_AJEC8|nr:hypothetical protein I7I53_03478 [Histoplasma capsulatum var. duboisii H88]